MSRRLIAVTALVVTAAALTACSGSTTPAESSSSEAGSDFGLVNDGVLTVATEGTYRPFSFHGDGGTGDLTGFDVEIIQAVADKLDLEIEFQETQWDAIFAGLDAGRFDLIANQVSINEERQEKYPVSYTHLTLPTILLV